MSSHRSLHEAFEAQVSRSPQSTAVSYNNESLTYEQLNARANRAAKELMKRGVVNDTLVGLCVPRGLDMIAGILGILKAGAADVLLDPACPAERLAWLLEDSQTPVIVTTTAASHDLPHEAARVLLDTLVAGPSDQKNSGSAGSASDAAYVIYTSGSTGTPKGVVVEHRQVLRLFAATLPSFEFSASDVWTMFHSFGFDFSVWEIWGALLFGGRLVVVPDTTTRSPEAFYELLRREKVTMLSQTPSAFQQLARADELSAKSHDARVENRGVRRRSVGPTNTSRAGLRVTVMTAPRLINMYGITETTVHVTYPPDHTR